MFAFANLAPVVAPGGFLATRSGMCVAVRHTPPRARPPCAPVTMLAQPASTDSEVRIRLYGNNIQITDSLRDYVDLKIGKVIRKYRALCTKVDVHLTVQRSVSAGQAAEVVVFSGKNIIRREVRSIDMYAAIDEVEDKLGRTLRKFKERREGKDHKPAGRVDPAVSLDVFDDETSDEDVDTFSSSAVQTPESLVPNVEGLVKRKTFPLTEQTIEEAILCLDYLDHDFYMFAKS